jgi:hypothetical protein
MNVWVFAFPRPDGRYGAVCDTEQRLMVTVRRAVAVEFATALEQRAGRPITAVERCPMGVAELVATQHVGITDIAPYVHFIEQPGEDDTDALFRASEAAEAIPLDTEGDWHAVHSRQSA